MNHTHSQISVIMCTYNRENWLPRSIESVLSQTFTDFEFIIVNNGSTDGSLEVCKHYASIDKRIKLISIEKNNGAPPGRNQGIEAASSEYLTFIDDDDYCDRQLLDYLFRLATQHQADISVCGSWYETDGVLSEKYVFEELLVLNREQGIEELLKREKYNVAPATKLYRIELFDKIRFKENVLVDDIHVIYKVFAKAARVVAQGKPLYHFHRHGQNMTSFNHTNHVSAPVLKEYLGAFKERTKYLSQEVPEASERVRYSEWSYMLSMYDKLNHLQNDEEYKALFDLMTRVIFANREELEESKWITPREQNIVKRMLTGNELQ